MKPGKEKVLGMAQEFLDRTFVYMHTLTSSLVCASSMPWCWEIEDIFF